MPSRYSSSCSSSSFSSSFSSASTYLSIPSQPAEGQPSSLLPRPLRASLQERDISHSLYAKGSRHDQSWHRSAELVFLIAPEATLFLCICPCCRRRRCHPRVSSRTTTAIIADFFTATVRVATDGFIRCRSRRTSGTASIAVSPLLLQF